jgi:[Skp1-protein]-hydroxyproline N-acetylglucosaminyltransferase
MINVLNVFLWSLFVFLLTILIGIIVNRADGFLSEGFGSECVDYIPFKMTKNYPIIPDAIFVSVASYRDTECSMTLDTLFNNAKYPELVFVGVCEQNKAGMKDELCLSNKVMKYRNNIRIKVLDHTQAKGPTYARYYCSELWRGEQYYLQIDSHTTFTKDWDQDLIDMINQIKMNPNESSRPVLSAYPPTKEQMDLKGFPEMDNGSLNNDNIPSFLCGWSEPSDAPKRSNKPWAAAGFMFLESDFLHTVPFDPNLSHLFQGEETLFSARLWTNGWNFYTPNRKVCYHHYNRNKAPLYHQDLTNSGECRTKAEKRVLFLLGLVSKQSVAEDFLRDYNKYGLGKFRPIADFWKVSGIDFSSKTVERWNDNNPPSDKFKGYNFRRDGYKNIKKWQ